MEIPGILLDEIKSGNVVLFLGAGASFDATHPNNNSILLGKNLSNKIAEKFLDSSYYEDDLTTVSELAISQKSLFDVQFYIKSLFEEYKPGPHHLLLPTFNWKAVFTTNYDLLIEEAYEQKRKEKDELQIINPIYKNTRQQEIFKPGHLPYLKLHGSFHSIDDEKLPLILTPDQYVSHKENRDLLFDHFKDFAYSYTVIFVGFSFRDLDIRSILNQLSVYENKPRAYMVGPNIRNAEVSLWESKKITSLVSSFRDFMFEIDKKIDKVYRNLISKMPKFENPIFSKFAISVEKKRPSEGFLNFIDRDIDFIHPAISAPNTDPKAFYKGYFADWDPIIRNLDVNRSLKDGILSEVFLNEEELNTVTQKLYIIKGHAGSGKSVLLKRIAWEAGNTFDLFCIFFKSSSPITYESIYELYSFVRTRIFIFIDQVNINSGSIEKLIERSQKDKIPITILAAERINVWNKECSFLDRFVEESFHLKFLNEKEIRELLSLLSRYDSLGYLKGKDVDEQINILKEKADRELLVALYESTHGKSFPEIIEDEFKSIGDPSAQSIYITVSILHRLGSYARAGLISRVHHINFEEFMKKFFKPLEYIVFANYDKKIEDYVYTTRHPQIAEMVFETVLKNKQDKYDEYIRILGNLNVDYNSDRNAFIAMTNATDLLSLFDDPIRIRSLYQVAEEKSFNDSKLFQQEAIFEMKRVNGNFQIAEEFLQKAYHEAPNDPVIAHSFAEFEYKKAENGRHKIEIFKHLDECKAICLRLIRRYHKDSHSYHTLIKSELLRLEYITNNSDGPTIERIVKEIEKYISEAKQYFPDEPFLLETESKFNALLNKMPEAHEALQKAFELNKSNPFICLRLANFYESQGLNDKAISICNETLKISPADKDINFKIGILLCKADSPNYQDVLHYFRKSFTMGDARYFSQLWYARTCFILKDYSKAWDIFSEIGKANIFPDVKYKPRGIIRNKQIDVSFTGTIIQKEFNYGFIRRDDFGDKVYFNRQTEEQNWESLENHEKVTFYLAFNYKGPLAINLYKLG
ncbi:MAG TPA: SIR2 family protein [Hanamia sp.]